MNLIVFEKNGFYNNMISFDINTLKQNINFKNVSNFIISYKIKIKHENNCIINPSNGIIKPSENVNVLISINKNSNINPELNKFLFEFNYKKNNFVIKYDTYIRKYNDISIQTETETETETDIKKNNIEIQTDNKITKNIGSECDIFPNYSEYVYILNIQFFVIFILLLKPHILEYLSKLDLV